MSPTIPFLIPNPIAKGLKKLELSDAISSGHVLMLDMVKRLPWYGTYCMSAGRGSTCQSALSLESGMICRLLEGLAARQALQVLAGSETSCAQ
jgi:hypothetical protein